MVYQFRITLPGIKGFYRIYKVYSANTFYSFHKQLQADLLFPADQPILFKAYDADRNVAARFALIDLGFGTVDEVPVGKALAAGITSFDYFYDTKAKKRIIITLEATEEGNAITVPTMSDDQKGPEPAAFDNGYVAYEDLPQEKRKPSGERNLLAALLGDDDSGEDDEDTDDEEEDDEDGKEIYDENE